MYYHLLIYTYLFGFQATKTNSDQFKQKSSNILEPKELLNSQVLRKIGAKTSLESP